MTQHTVHLSVKYTEKEIQDRIQHIAYEFYNSVKCKLSHYLVVIGILKGALPLCNDLLKCFTGFPLVIDYIQVSSYDGTSSTEQITFEKDVTLPDHLVKNHHILVVEDIIDTGQTLKFIIDHLTAKYNPVSIDIATVIDKPYRRKYNFSNYKIYSCFKDDSKDFLAGYGLDYNQFFRNMNHIVRVEV